MTEQQFEVGQQVTLRGAETPYVIVAVVGGGLYKVGLAADFRQGRGVYHEASLRPLAAQDWVSDGHLAFVGDREFFRVGSAVHTAPKSAPVMPGYRRRAGRWECSVTHALRYPGVYPALQAPLVAWSSP